MPSPHLQNTEKPRGVTGVKSAILPVGSTEQHGPHLPLGTDSLIAQKISRALAEELKADTVPGLNYGVSHEHADFPGTVSIPPETLLRTVRETCENLLRSYQRVIIINAHGGNTNTLRSLQDERVILIDLFDTLREVLTDIRETEVGGVCHACEVETSLMLHLEPSMVNRKKITEEIVRYVPHLDPQSESPAPNGWKTINYSKSGVIGDPTKATPEKGEKIFNTLIETMVKTLKKNKTKEENTQKPER